ncbi:hypothetical protein [Thiolapillus sp.]|uniref:hypothetical protein n=1 Tax=Thiolapillus sp. TaxID=2017437 RepID=UPI003AF8645C
MTTYSCPRRPGHQALRNNLASSLLLRIWLPYDWTPRSAAYFASPLALCARRVSSAASRLLGSTSLRFALHGWQRRRDSLFLYLSGRVKMSSQKNGAASRRIVKST